MNTGPMLAHALKELDASAKNSLKGTKLNKISSDIHAFAIAAAVAGGVANVAPGIGGIAAMLTQTGLVWTLYVKINNTLGIKTSENVMKFVGSAMITNIVTNAGTLIAGYALAAVLSWIPVFGQASAAAIDILLGYMLIYVSAVLYLGLLTKMMAAKGTFELDETKDTEQSIKDLVGSSNVSAIMKEGRKAYSAAKNDGTLKSAMEHPKCPSCGASVDKGQRFCGKCGMQLH